MLVCIYFRLNKLEMDESGVFQTKKTAKILQLISLVTVLC